MSDRDARVAARSRPQAPHISLGLSRDDLLKIYRKMLLTRALDQRWWQLNRQGKAAIAISCQGHEAAQIGSVLALHPERDLFFTYYRSLAVAVALGVTSKEFLLSCTAKAGDPFSGARQFPLHGAYGRFINISNVVGTQISQAVGAALAFRLRKEPGLAITYFGDGAASQGECHEAMNFAGVHRLPVIFFCENNGYAISVPMEKQMAIRDIALRAKGYGFPGVIVDGTDLFEVFKATQEAAARARGGEGPTLIEAKVERIMPHTSDDDDRRYRPAEELEDLRQRSDPIATFRAYLLREGILSEQGEEEYRQKAQVEVDEATEFAESAPYPDQSTIFEHLYSPEDKRS